MAQTPGSGYQVQEGDLLFQDLDCGPFCTAIEAVTEGRDGQDFSHIGMVVKDNEDVLVLEAVSAGVVLTPLDTFLHRHTVDNGKPAVWAGRIRLPKYVVRKAVARAKTHLGKPYDQAFGLDNGRYYCSELIRDAYRKAHGEYLFDLAPMTFKDPATGNYFPEWVGYFQKLGKPIPQGAPGINPGLISRNRRVEIVYKFF